MASVSPASNKPRLVVIGNGMAGVRTVEELLKRAPRHFDITIIGAEAHGNYNRILLSPVLAGEKKAEQIITHPPSWYGQQGIRLINGDAVARIDREAQTVVTDTGRSIPYDALLLATGSKPFMLPVPGRHLPGVVAFRDFSDVNFMLKTAEEYRYAVVIGGGLLGLEAACALAKRGMQVRVVHKHDSLMERQLDRPAAKLLQANLEQRGLKFALQADTAEVMGQKRVRAVRLADGRELPADLVVMAIGVVPHAALAKAAGVDCERGIVVDDAMRSSDTKIWAVGECIQHRKVCYGLVAPLWEQAAVCADSLLGTAAQYQGSVTCTKLKVTGIDLFSAGNFNGGEGCEDLIYRDPRRGIYKKLVLKEGKLEGAVLYGDTRDGGWYFDLIQQQKPVQQWRQKLVFGPRFLQA